MAMILSALRMAHVVSAFAPRSGQIGPSQCGRETCRRPLTRPKRIRSFMSTEDIGTSDSSAGSVFDDVDSIGETVGKVGSSDSAEERMDGSTVMPSTLEGETLTLPTIVNQEAHTLFEELVDGTEANIAILEEVSPVSTTMTGLEEAIVEQVTRYDPGDDSPDNFDGSEDPNQNRFEMLDPAAVVAAVIETSLSDTESNSAIPSPNLLPDSIKKDLMAGIRGEHTAEQVEEQEEFVEHSSLSKIIKFAIPAIGVWLCGPILSLIDTGSVGLLSGTAQQAALNPAVAITDYGGLLVAFMYTATTNLVATTYEKEKDNVKGKPLTAKTLITSLQLSAMVGAGLGTVLITCARFFLRSIIGNDSIDPEVFSAATRYVQIRALGMPAAVVIGSAQSASLGMQDIKSPLYVLAAAAIVNFLGDMIFVGQSNPIFGGAAGAAWATVFSQYAALAMFLKWFVNKPGGKRGKTEKINLTNAIMELTGDGGEGTSRRKSFRNSLRELYKSKGRNKQSTRHLKNNVFLRFKSRKGLTKANVETESFSVRGFLHGQFRKTDILRIPEKKLAMKFRPFFVPVTTTAVGRVSSYIAMSHVVSSALGTTAMAANQVILSLFYCLTPVADSLNLTAQSFVPAIFQKKNLPSGAVALKKTSMNFLKAGVLFGAVMVSAVACIPLLCGLFTSDPTVIAQVNAAVLPLAGCLGVHGVICALEGVLLGRKDLGFLGKTYAVYFAAVPYFMLRVKKAALSGAKNVSITSVWQVFLAYQMVRLLLWIGRVMQLQYKMERQVESALQLEQ